MVSIRSLKYIVYEIKGYKPSSKLAFIKALDKLPNFLVRKQQNEKKKGKSSAFLPLIYGNNCILSAQSILYEVPDNIVHRPKKATQRE